MSRPADRRRPQAARTPRLRWGALALAALVVGVAAVVWLRARPDVPAEPTLNSEGVTPFDGDRAFALVERQVAFGPRVPGSEAHDAMLVWLVGRLDSLADRVERQPVGFDDPGEPGRRIEGTNVLASFAPDAPRRVMLAAHWDSRPVADEDPDPAKRALPVDGANDGASGVAVLLEVARVLRESGPPPGLGVDLVFFDLEDLGRTPADRPDSLKLPFAAGSELFVRANPTYQPAWGVLLDMVGDVGLRLPREAYSEQHAPEVVNAVWAAAGRVGSSAFVPEVGWPVEDDHLPFLRRGIPVIDVVQTPFPDTWHTASDRPERVSAESLRQVGAALIEALWSDSPSS